MNTKQIMGLETEYAALVEGSDRPDLSFLFEHVKLPYRAKWDYQPESPWCDARGFVPAAEAPPPYQLPLEVVTDSRQAQAGASETHGEPSQTIPVEVEQEEPPGFMMPNGSRFYLDHAHPEWSIPECATPLEVVLYDKAGDVWLSHFAKQVNGSLSEQGRVTLFKNNTDAYGNTYGCHENYLVETATYTALFEQQAHRLYRTLIPFLVSRQILCGSGKIAPQGYKGQMGFHISQRADVFERILGLQTTYRRPIINTRDEPLADPSRFRRLHVIVGDSNLSEYSTYLKVGTTALVLEMLAADRLRMDLTLANPLRAIRSISRDPECKQTVELETDRRLITAIDIQHHFLEAAGRYLDERGDNSFRRKVWEIWVETVDGLADHPSNLADKLDWAIKYELFQVQMEENGWNWASPQIRELDIRYHQLDPEQSLFLVLKNKGLVESLVDDQEIQKAQTHAPQTTRAALRTACLNRFGEQIRAVNWDTLVFRGEEGRDLRWRWGDPTGEEGAILKRLIQESGELEQFVRAALALKGKQNNETRYHP
jgi:proteasome accessory factor A